MAALLRVSTSLESKPTRRRKHHVRPRSRSRIPPNEPYTIRSSPPRQIQRSPPLMMAALNVSQSSLSAPMEHLNGITMERTPSGNSIMSDTPYIQAHDNTFTYRDQDARQLVENHMKWSPKDSQHERILRKLIKPHRRLSHGFLDDEYLDSILTAADTVFFGNKLSGRVQWEWSSDGRYKSELIGTTALRRCAHRKGYETLIILSEPILRSERYDRRLLLSAFLHELIHCYLFILCGFEARIQGGHTDGFHAIAKIIDDWVGEGYLSLCNMKANLNHFRKGCNSGGESGREGFCWEET